MSHPISVFFVHHNHVHENGEECLKLIGVYESNAAAEAAVDRVAVQQGFKDWPQIFDVYEVDQSGFYIDEYTIGEDHWTEGYVTDTEVSVDLPGWFVRPIDDDPQE